MVVSEPSSQLPVAIHLGATTFLVVEVTRVAAVAPGVDLVAEQRLAGERGAVAGILEGLAAGITSGGVGRAGRGHGFAAGGVAGVTQATFGADLDPREEGLVLLVDDLLIDERALRVGARDPLQDRAALRVLEVDQAAGVEAGHGLAGGLLHEHLEVDAGEVAGVVGSGGLAGEQRGDAPDKRSLGAAAQSSGAAVVLLVGWRAWWRRRRRPWCRRWCSRGRPAVAGAGGREREGRVRARRVGRTRVTISERGWGGEG